MSEDITVACVLKSGGRYNAEWVRKLRDAVARHLTLPYRFVCLSDVDVPCERIPLLYDWPLLARQRGHDHDWTVAPAWWSKLELFRPGLFSGAVLYIDLDSIVIGPLDRIVSYPHQFTMAHDPWNRDHLCSTAMAWTGDHSFLFDAFMEDPGGIARRYDVDEPKNGRIGDQAFIEDQFRAFDFKVGTFREVVGRNAVVSYKVDCREGPPNDASIVALHGNPKQDQLGHIGWVTAAWT